MIMRKHAFAFSCHPASLPFSQPNSLLPSVHKHFLFQGKNVFGKYVNNTNTLIHTQVLSEETAGGRLKFKTIKSEETKSILLIYDADLLHSGKYSCYPSNTEIASIRVHVLQGKLNFSILDILLHIEVNLKRA